MRTAKREYADSLTINQLGEAADFRALISVIAQSYDSIDDLLHYISTINVMQAKGVWLDLIGLIVGQSRTVPTVVEAKYFGYDGQPTAVGYGQARYRKAGDSLSPTSILGDDEYRNAIFGRIARNFGALDEISMVEAIQSILQTNAVQLDRPTAGTISVIFTGYITEAQEAMISGIDLIPRAAGVKLDIQTVYP